MCSYNRVNGPQACESPAVVEALKGTGWNGFVVPDFGLAVRDPLAATLAGRRRAGARRRRRPDRGDVHLREVPPERLDDIVRRILYGLIDVGRVRRPAPAPGRRREHARAPGGRDAHRRGEAWSC